MTKTNRRDFLQKLGGQALGVTLLGTASACSTLRPEPAPSPADGVLDYVLDVGWKRTTLDGTPVRLRAYNDQVPGPLLEVRPGDVVRILVRNHLTHYDSSGWNGDHNVPHMLNTTNLHLHGLEIVPHLFEPVGTADPLAEMIAIRPGEEKRYRFKIPDDQPSGLFWYHPHHHGSTAVQAVTGMAGGLVVRGPIDEVPEIAAAREQFIVVNDIGLFPSEGDPDVWTYEPKQNTIWNTMESQVLKWNPATEQMEPAPECRGGFTTGDYKLRYFLVNGQPFFKEEHRPPAQAASAQLENCSGFKPAQDPIATQLDVPRYRMRPGEVVRYRMLNANSDDVMPIVVEGHQVHMIALDGVNFLQPRTLPIKPITGEYGDEQFILAPANRAEFLLRAGAPGVYRIVQLKQCQQFLTSAHRVIAEIEVTGDPITPPMALPSTLPTPTRHYPLIQPDEIKRRRNVVFTMAFPGMLNPIVGLDFMINNNAYDERAVDAVVDRGTAEEWHISVPDANHGGTEGHPFHVHVNSFEVISVDGEPLPEGTIQDTIWVESGKTVVIRMKFREWTGKSVYHCHILPHEDTGMMQNFLIHR